MCDKKSQVIVDMLDRAYLGRHLTLVAIILFVVVFALLHYLKPSFMYNKDGSVRQFGLGFSKKTVIPIWLVTVILAILSYYAVMHFALGSKISY